MQGEENVAKDFIFKPPSSGERGEQRREEERRKQKEQKVTPRRHIVFQFVKHFVK